MPCMNVASAGVKACTPASALTFAAGESAGTPAGDCWVAVLQPEIDANATIAARLLLWRQLICVNELYPTTQNFVTRRDANHFRSWNTASTEVPSARANCSAST